MRFYCMLHQQLVQPIYYPLELKQLVSADQVSRVWLGEVSGWDARAVTG